MPAPDISPGICNLFNAQIGRMPAPDVTNPRFWFNSFARWRFGVVG
jgi:hypothetical protein